MKLTDIALIAIACLCAYGAIDSDGAADVLRKIGNTAVATFRG
jgi:hypothetical protein